jgi:hypothetical protein
LKQNARPPALLPGSMENLPQTLPYLTARSFNCRTTASASARSRRWSGSSNNPAETVVLQFGNGGALKTLKQAGWHPVLHREESPTQ